MKDYLKMIGMVLGALVIGTLLWGLPATLESAFGLLIIFGIFGIFNHFF